MASRMFFPLFIFVSVLITNWIFCFIYRCMR